MSEQPINTAAQARAFLEGSLPNHGLTLPCYVCDAAAGQSCDPACPDLNELIDEVEEVDDDLYREMADDARAGR